MAGPYPTAYKSAVAAWVRSLFLDPYTLRDAFVTKPVEIEAKNNQFGWLVCLSVNARNRFGAYTGSQGHALLMRDNSVIDTYPKAATPNMPIGVSSYDRSMARLNALQDQLDAITSSSVLNLCGEAIQSGRTSAERFIELEGRR